MLSVASDEALLFCIFLGGRGKRVEEYEVGEDDAGVVEENFAPPAPSLASAALNQ